MRGTPIEEIAELLGSSMEIVEKYYTKVDTRRQARLEKRLEDFWETDPVTENLASQKRRRGEAPLGSYPNARLILSA
jgi:hypothetical protein